MKIKELLPLKVYPFILKMYNLHFNLKTLVITLSGIIAPGKNFHLVWSALILDIQQFWELFPE